MTDRTWTGSLAELRDPLTAEAWRLQGGWAWYLMPRGALVALRVRPEDFRKEFRIARKEAPADEAAAAKWYQEVAVFAKHLGCEGWKPTLTPGKAEVFLLEPEPYSDVKKHKSSEVPCADCGEPTHED